MGGKRMKKILVLVLVMMMTMSMMGCGAKEEDAIVIGCKNYTEQEILLYLMKDIIEAKTDLTVETKPYLGGTDVASKALEKGDIDIYPEYTGTALIAILQQEVMSDPQAVYDKVKEMYEEKNLVWLKPFGFNNTYTLTMRADRAEEMGLETFSDLAEKSSDLDIGGTQEFLEREDGYLGLKETYGMDFKDTKGMDPGLMYTAVKEKQVDVISAFATDGRIIAFNLKSLKDDKNFFPPYYAAPIIRQDTLDAYPEIEEALNQLGGKLDDAKMGQLNAQVDLEKKDAEDVAHEWLKSEGLIN